MNRAASVFAWLETHPRWSALGLGALAALGFRPLALWPLTLLAMAGLLALTMRTERRRDAALLGWLFGLAHFTLGNNWIATAFTYQAEMPALLGWAAVPLLSLYLAVYPAFAALAARMIAGNRLGWPAVLAFAGCWIVSEWLRGWVFTGYPWNPLGAVLLGGFHSQGVAALLPWLGTYALSGLAVLLPGAGLLLALGRRMVPLGALVALLVAAMHSPAGKGREGHLPVTLVQPDFRQEELNDPRFFEAQFATIARLSLPLEPAGHRLVVWPESGLPDYLQDDYPQRYYDQMTAGGDPAFARARVGRVIGTGGLLLTGTVDLEIAGGKAVGAYNAVTALDHAGGIRGSYAKAHLVPYGEYLALRWLLEPLGASRLVAGAFDFIPGPGPRTLDLGQWGKVGPQICYEIIFSGHVVDRAHRPDYIYNPSNDGWFGSWGPPQHLAQARMRAIEEGLPVLRATTTGISAIIDARGIVRHHAPMREARRIDATVPPAAAPTPFSRLGNLLPLAWAALLISTALVATLRARR
ncbi:MAG: apolipoprotein N-acyltransferase [Novosphingobium sp.]